MHAVIDRRYEDGRFSDGCRDSALQGAYPSPQLQSCSLSSFAVSCILPPQCPSV